MTKRMTKRTTKQTAKPPARPQSESLQSDSTPSGSTPSESTSPALSLLRSALLHWYAQHRRTLPWRQNRDAYRVWLSEIMLQQTRVAAVLVHYRAFLEAFPTLQSLALAREEQVLARWSGLGYYRRARMFHRAARMVVSELQGVIPRTVEALRQLPGVGRYTAAAIASIAFEEPSAVVDGNVQRVLSRLDDHPHADTSVWSRAQRLLDPRHPGEWNQAMMELGATVCLPRNPQCLLCPLRPWCQAPPRAPGAATTQPIVARKRLNATRALIQHKHCLYLVQRAAEEPKMAGMWELPEYAADAEGITSPDAGPGLKQLCHVRHSITDTDYQVRVVRSTLKALPPAQRLVANKSGRWVGPAELPELPLTGLTRKILRKLGLPAPAL